MARIIWDLKDIMEVIFGCLLNKYDCVIYVDGKRGLGKSTLAFKIASRMPKFNPKKDIVFTRDDVNKHLHNKFYSVIFADEFVNVAHNRDFYLQDQKDLIKQLNMYRDHYNLFIGCIPFFMRLDVQMLELCKIRLTCIKRGIALVQVQLGSLYSNDPWDIKNNLRIESKYISRGKRPPYHKLTTYRGVLYFSDLTKEQRKLYEQIKNEKRGYIMQDKEELNNKNKEDNKLKEVYQLLINGHIKTLDDFIICCNTLKIKYDYGRRKINTLLKDNGMYNKTLKDFIKLEEKVKVKEIKQKEVLPQIIITDRFKS